jgi:hypothetical protein
VLCLAVQLLDILWAPFVLVGLEKVRIIPGITASTPLDLYYMPYTHSLVAAVAWAGIGGLLYHVLAQPTHHRALTIVALAVFSHWILDLIVHRPDLPLYGNAAKVGLGLWNAPALAVGLESALFFGGMWLYLRGRPGRSVKTAGFGVALLAIQAYASFGPPPVSGHAAASTVLVACAVVTVAMWWMHDRRTPTRAA